MVSTLLRQKFFLYSHFELKNIVNTYFGKFDFLSENITDKIFIN